MPGADLSDNQLAALAGQGDAEAYRRLFERYQNPVYNFVYRLVNNAEDASDIVQNAFLRMYTVLGEKDVQNFSAYLYRTAKNLAYDEMRRRARFADVDEELLAPEDPNIYADPQRALQLEEQLGTVRKAAEKLNENQRAALIMRELQDMDYDQMSEVLDSNRNAVGALLTRARLRFREELRMAQIQTDRIPPDCEEIIAMLSPYLDHELSQEDVGKVDDHCRECTFCTAALEEMREASRSFRMLIPVVPPPGLAEAFEGSLDGLAGRGSMVSRLIHNRVFWISLAAITVFGIGLFVLAESTVRDDRPDEEILFEEEAPPNGDDLDEITTTPEEPAVIPPTTTRDEEPLPPGPDPGQDTPTGLQTPTGVQYTSINPNPAYEDSQFTVTVEISGSASSVNASVQGLGDITLHKLSGGGGSETWSGTGTAASASEHEVYIFAASSGGGGISEFGGVLQVISSYPTVTPQ